MKELKQFTDILTGHFDNSEQFNRLKAEGVKGFPYAEHINTVCNDNQASSAYDVSGNL